MNIGLLTTSFPRSEPDIAGSFVLAFARQLHAHGHRVQVLAPEPRERGAQTQFAAHAPASIQVQHVLDTRCAADAGEPIHVQRVADPDPAARHADELIHVQRVADPTSRALEARHASDPGEPIHVQHVPYLRPRMLQRTFYGAGVPDNLARDPLAWLGPVPFCANLYWQARRAAPRWQALISHWALPCALAAGALRRRHQLHIAVLHSADIHALSSMPGGAHLAERVARGASALWFVSEAQRERFLALLPRGTRLPPNLVCPMGVELPPPTAADVEVRERYRRAHDLSGFCVLLLGRLVHIKGVDVALQAAARGGMTLLIAGDGPLRQSLMRRAQQLGAAARFLGVVTGRDKQALLQAADAFALPSRQLASGRSEGLPCALLEALAAGLPVAATRLPGIDDFLEQHAQQQHAPPHRLVPGDDPAALHAALLTLRERQSARTTRDPSRRALIARYGWPKVGEHLSELLTVSNCGPEHM